jgi:hypothetical protein
MKKLSKKEEGGSSSNGDKTKKTIFGGVKTVFGPSSDKNIKYSSKTTRPTITGGTKTTWKTIKKYEEGPKVVSKHSIKQNSKGDVTKIADKDRKTFKKGGPVKSKKK